MLLGAGATDYLLDLWISTAMNHPSGRLDGMDEVDIALEAGWEGEPAAFCRALVECRFLDVDEDGVYVLHDWEDHQPYVLGAEARTERARNAARSRWGYKENASGMRGAMQETESSNAPSPSPSPSPSPKPNQNPYVGQKPTDAPESGGKPPKIAHIPHAQIMDFWNTIVGPRGKPRIKSMTDFRKKALRRMWQDLGEDADFTEPDVWRQFFEFCTRSEILMDGGWFTFDWLFKPANFQKVLEGNYHGRRRRAWQESR